MLALLNPRFLIGLAIVGALTFTHFFVYRAGKNHVRTQWDASIAAANNEARKISELRQSRVDEAQKLGAARQAGIRADSARTASAVDGLRHAIAARDMAEESAAAAAKRAAALGVLLVQSAEAHRELAERCDRHVSDLRTLLQSWPQ